MSSSGGKNRDTKTTLQTTTGRVVRRDGSKNGAVTTHKVKTSTDDDEHDSDTMGMSFQAIHITATHCHSTDIRRYNFIPEYLFESSHNVRNISNS
jgi:hypothetical protein